MLERLFPAINDWALASLAAERAQLVRQARGDVLELGLGTGLNLAYYQEISALHGVEPAAFMRARAAQRQRELAFPVTVTPGFAEQLPLDAGRFDTVVVTFVLCSVRDPQQALAEVARVLKPGGQLLLLEHVRSDDPALARWQDRVTPLWRVLLGGCHPNRALDALPEQAGLAPIDVTRFLADQVRLAAPHVRGVWQKP